jgi:hypothetical protein
MLATLLQMDMGSVDPMERVYFWVGALIALPPVAVFGTIGFLAIRGYFRDRVRKPDAVPTPTGGLRG